MLLLGLGLSACRGDNPAYNENVTLGAVDAVGRPAARDAGRTTPPSPPTPVPAPVVVIDAAPTVVPPPINPSPLPIDSGPSTAPPPMNPPPPVDAAPDLLPTLPTADPTRFNFETDRQGWGDLRNKGTAVRRSTAKPYAGVGSLEIDLLGDSLDRYVGVAGALPLPPGTPITYRIWIPAGPRYTMIQAFILYFQKGQAMSIWEGHFQLPAAAPQFKTNQWNTFTVVVPATSTGLVEIGVNFVTSGITNAKAYIDSVTW